MSNTVQEGLKVLGWHLGKTLRKPMKTTHGMIGNSKGCSGSGLWSEAGQAH